jgi:hypothetical protein
MSEETMIIAATLGIIALCGVVAWIFIGLMMKGLSLTDPVRGSLKVVAASPPPDDAHASNYRLDGVVTGPGLTPTAVTKSGMAKVSKWPAPGEDLPIAFERGDPSRFNILWDEVETGDVIGRRAAELTAAMMGGRPPEGNSIDLTGETDVGATVHDLMRRDGRRGQATVTGVDARVLDDGGTQAALTLKVQPEDGAAAYETALNFHFVSQSSAGRDFFCRPGVAFPVLISKAEPLSVIPDFDALPQELRPGR